MDQLAATARGDYLYGGQAQDAFVDAYRRAALPDIFSTYGAAGRGDLGGLAKTAIATAGGDAYARLYGDERTRQLQAAELLPSITQMPLERQQKLYQAATGGAAQFAPFLGQRQTGTSLSEQLGRTLGSQFGTTAGTTTGEQLGTTAGTTTGTQYGETTDQAITRTIQEMIARERTRGTAKTNATQTVTPSQYTPGLSDYLLAGGLLAGSFI